VLPQVLGYPFYTPHPIFVERGKGSKVYDVDGNEYIDYLCAFGASHMISLLEPYRSAVENEQLEKEPLLKWSESI